MHFLQVAREGLHPISVQCHDHWVWNHTTESARASLLANLLGDVLCSLVLHRGLVRGGLGILQLDEMGDVVRLTSKEVLLELLRVDHAWEVSLHLGLALQQLGKVLVDWHLGARALRERLSAWQMLVLGLKQDLVEPGGFIALSTLEEVCTSGRWRLLIFDDGVDVPDREINSLGELILIVHFEPFLNIFSWLRLNILTNLKLSEILFLQDDIIFRCFGRLTKLCPIRRLLGIFPESLLSSLDIDHKSTHFLHL